jgi:tetratricopeptide (TPR) repeat protein
MGTTDLKPNPESGKIGPMEIPTASPEARPAPEPKPKPALRPAHRRGWLAVQVVILASLGWITYRNASDSPSLVQAAEAERRGDFPSALRAATEHLARRPWSREARRIFARCLSRLDFAEMAEREYAAAGPLTVEDLRYRAYGLTRVNLRERAVRAFDDLLARQPDDIASLRLQAGVLLSMARWDDVTAIGRRLAAMPDAPATFDAPVMVGNHWTLRPREVASVRVIGATLEAMGMHNKGEPDEAVVAYEAVLALDPDFRSVPIDRRLFWSQYGQDLLSVGQAARLLGLLAIEDSGQSDAVLVGLRAQAHAQLGAVEDAANSWRRVLALVPDSPQALRSLGRIASGRGDHTEAARLLSRAEQIAPGSLEAAYHLGLAYRRLGQETVALKWEHEAARLREAAEEKTRGLPLPPTSAAPGSPRPPDAS